MHTHGSGGRRRGKPRSRILYWFRTPPGVRVGRSALDEDAIRLIEQHNPDVEFDWTRILKGPEGKGPEDAGDSREASQPERRSRPRRPAPERETRPEVHVAPAVDAVAEETPLEVTAASPTVEQPAESSSENPSDENETEERQVAEAFLLEPRVEPSSSRPHAGDALSAVEARLGSEGLSRLRGRYSEVLARISETVLDPARQEELKTTAERLNPDTWVTEAEVQAGLEDYESVFESLRSIVGRRRRRGRRSSERRRNRGPESSETDSALVAQEGFPNEAEDEEEPGPAEQQ